jgi:hypothetical protein
MNLVKYENVVWEKAIQLPVRFREFSKKNKLSNNSSDEPVGRGRGRELSYNYVILNSLHPRLTLSCAV